MSIFDFFRRKTKKADEIRGMPGDVLPRPGKWLRITVPGKSGDAIIYTYIDPEAGLSGKGYDVDSMNPSIEECPHLTVRIPGGCEEWRILGEGERKEMLLPESPRWISFLGKAKGGGSKKLDESSGALPTEFDLKVDAWNSELTKNRKQWLPFLQEANVRIGNGDLSGAGEYLDKAEKLSEKLGDPYGKAAITGDWANIAIQRGQFDEAMERFQTQAQMCEEHGYANILTLCLRNQVAILINAEQFKDANIILQRMERIAASYSIMQALQFIEETRKNNSSL